jgi:peptidoglycan hydrolase-like protein with peptidoglycan-binding domain
MTKQLALVVGTVAALGIPSAASTAPAEPAPICTAVPPGATLVVPVERGVALTTADGSEVLDVALPATPAVAARGPDGTVWAEVPTGVETAEVYRVAPGREATLAASGVVGLSSVGWLDGRSAAVVIDRTRRADQIEEYGAVIVDYADGRRVEVKPAGGPEYEAVSVTVGAGRLVEGARVDLTEAFQYYGSDGTPHEDWFDPTDAAPYAEPPLYQWPVVDQPGSGDPAEHVLSWVEGPDWDVATNEPVGAWTMVLADAATGEERARVDVGEPGGALLHADFDDWRWVGSFESKVVVFDLTEPAAAPVDAGCPAGIVATIDRFGQPEPAQPASATTQPATTAQPTTTAPVCPTYEPNDRYPIRLCDEGAAVQAIQMALAAAGHTVEVDGFFGPLTEAEVRRFQQAHALEVDGLVGDDTWAALMPLAPPPGTDVDGSGVVDPWELGVTRGVGGRRTAGDFIGFEFGSVSSDGVVRAVDGTPIPEIEYLEGWWIAGDGAGLGTSGLQAFHVRVDGNHMLWTTTLLFDPDTERVDDAVDLGLAEGQSVSRACFLDGAPVGEVQSIDDVAVFGVVAGQPGEQAPVSRAFSVSVPEGTIAELDAARVTCAAD